MLVFPVRQRLHHSRGTGGDAETLRELHLFGLHADDVLFTSQVQVVERGLLDFDLPGGKRENQFVQQENNPLQRIGDAGDIEMEFDECHRAGGARAYFGSSLRFGCDTTSMRSSGTECISDGTPSK